MNKYTHQLEQTIRGNGTDSGDIEDIFAAMLSGALPDALIAGYLTAWRCHGTNPETLVAGAKYMRANAKPVSLDKSVRPLADNCGTGGSGIAKFNISTAAAVVAASMGIRIAKHGNRSSSGRCGSADLLFRAGFPEQLSTEKAAALLKETGFTFFFAPNFHPVVGHVMPTRKSLGVKTILNLLGPLANPIAPEIQLLGVGQKDDLEPMAKALVKLGVKKALVVHSDDGLDEISPCATTHGFLIEQGSLAAMTINPRDYGINVKSSEILGGEVETNFQLFEKLLAGEEIGVAGGVVLNAGALAWLTGQASSIGDGVNAAHSHLKNGTCAKFFKSWLEKANG